MSRLSDANVALAHEIIARYPKSRSATIPLLHLSQQQNGYVTDDAMAHVAELVGSTSAEVQGTATFYEMFKFHPVGTYLVNICGTMSCALMGSEELLHHAEQALDVSVARVATTGEQAVDVFYVHERGQKVTDPARVEGLRMALFRALRRD